MVLTEAQQSEIAAKRKGGASLRTLAKEYETSVASVQRAEVRAS
jgi:hypothetical protein